MGHVIEIPEQLFRRLQAIARPLVDTPVTVIERLVDHYDGDQPVLPAGSSLRLHRFGPSSAPDFTHTRVLTASFAGQETARPRWNELVRKVHEVALARGLSLEQLMVLTTANLCEGVKSDEGFKPARDLRYSIQGVDANDAWRISYDLARKLKCGLRVEFEWRAKDEAEFPGERGVVEWDAAG